MKHNVIRGAALACSLSLAACSGSGSSSHETHSSPSTTPQATGEARANQLWLQGIDTLRQDFLRNQKLSYIANACVMWSTGDGNKTLVRNPVIYTDNPSSSEQFYFYGFVNVPETKFDSVKDVVLMNGPYDYVKLDKDGQAIPGQDILQPANLIVDPGVPVGIEDDVPVSLDPKGSWGMVGPDGTPIDQTEVVSNPSQEDIAKFCGYTATSGSIN